MELEVRHLRVLCAIADTGSLHKAARELGMAQPSLSTQLRRIEHALGGPLFSRERTGCRPTPLGRAVLSRARPLVAELAALVTEARAAAARTAGGTQLRIGATASRAISGWLRRLRARPPGTEPTLQMDVSPNALLRMVADAHIDVAFVHEVEGSPLRVPRGVSVRVLVQREPQFVAIAADHPAALHPEIRLADLAADRWMLDSTVDGERDALCRVFRAAGLEPHILHGDYLSASHLVATGEVVTIIQPTGHPRPDLVIRPLQGDPIGVRLLLAARTEAELDAVYQELEEAYWETAWEAPAYRDWLRRSAVLPPPGTTPPDGLPANGLPARSLSEDALRGKAQPENALSVKALPVNALSEKALPEHDIPVTTRSENPLPDHGLPDHDLRRHDLPARDLPDHALPDHALPDHALPDHDLPDRDSSDRDLPDRDLDLLRARRHEPVGRAVTGGAPTLPKIT